MKAYYQRTLPKLINPATDGISLVQWHRDRAQINLNKARCLENLSDQRRLRARERQKLRKYQKLYRHHCLWVDKWHRCGGVCERCLVRAMEQLHHKHYRTVGTERVEDTEGLCSDCHHQHHRCRTKPERDSFDYFVDDLLKERGYKVS